MFAGGAGRLALAIAAVAVLVAIAGLILLAIAIRNFFRDDPRFRITTSSSIQIMGNSQVTRPELLSVFGSDLGRNIFFIPLAERRASLEQLPWVEHATVMRLLPDQLRIAIVERTPVAFVRQGNTRGLFENRGVVSILTGEPEYLDPLGEETPDGWIVTGYPVDSLTDPANKAFIDAYKAKYNDRPKMGSVVGYALINAIVAGIKKTGAVDSEKLAEGFAGADFGTPFGNASWRTIDHQSTLGTYVGKTALKDDKPTMVDWRYVDGISALPPDAEVKKMRPA